MIYNDHIFKSIFVIEKQNLSLHFSKLSSNKGMPADISLRLRNNGLNPIIFHDSIQRYHSNHSQSEIIHAVN